MSMPGSAPRVRGTAECAEDRLVRRQEVVPITGRLGDEQRIERVAMAQLDLTDGQYVSPQDGQLFGERLRCRGHEIGGRYRERSLAMLDPEFPVRRDRDMH